MTSHLSTSISNPLCSSSSSDSTFSFSSSYSPPPSSSSSNTTTLSTAPTTNTSNFSVFSIVSDSLLSSCSQTTSSKFSSFTSTPPPRRCYSLSIHCTSFSTPFLSSNEVSSSPLVPASSPLSLSFSPSASLMNSPDTTSDPTLLTSLVSSTTSFHPLSSELFPLTSLSSSTFFSFSTLTPSASFTTQLEQTAPLIDDHVTTALFSDSDADSPSNLSSNVSSSSSSSSSSSATTSISSSPTLSFCIKKHDSLLNTTLLSATFIENEIKPSSLDSLPSLNDTTLSSSTLNKNDMTIHLENTNGTSLGIVEELNNDLSLEQEVLNSEDIGSPNTLIVSASPSSIASSSSSSSSISSISLIPFAPSSSLSEFDFNSNLYSSFKLVDSGLLLSLDEDPLDVQAMEFIFHLPPKANDTLSFVHDPTPPKTTTTSTTTRTTPMTSPTPSSPSPSSSLVEMNAFLLPPIHPSKTHTLVLDLDETLLHCSTCPLPSAGIAFSVEFNETQFDIYGNLRPHLVTFLEAVSEKYEVVVFTASQEVYAERVLNLVDPHQQYISHRLYRDSCVLVNGNYLKDLSRLGRNLATTLIVDNTPQSFGYHLANGIPIRSWYDDPCDQQLLKLKEVLLALSEYKDVRQVVKECSQIHRYLNQCSKLLGKRPVGLLEEST